jgi:hypothetical protein
VGSARQREVELREKGRPIGPAGRIPRAAWRHDGPRKQGIGSFAQTLNTHLAVFGYACNFTLDPFEIGVTSSKDNHCGLSLKQLSESERFRFSVAFQLALATATGIRFIVIDRADVLDRERRKLLTVLLSNSDVEQAIVLATSEEALPSIVPEGVKFLALGVCIKRDQATISVLAEPNTEPRRRLGYAAAGA